MERELILKLNTGTIYAQLAKSRKILVQGVEIMLHAGESLALIGETGSGKTMTARSAMRLLPSNVKQEGERICYRGEELPKGKKLTGLTGTEIVYIPQSGADSLNPSLTVQEQFQDGMRKNRIPYLKRRLKTDQILKEVGFSDPQKILSKYAFELSGGMAQRVTIALAAIGEPKLILADEPTNGLDKKATEEFFSLISHLFPNAAKLIITHDISVARLCDRAAVLCKGRMCETGFTAEVIENPWHPYTQAMIGALVANGMQETPVLREQAGNCPFYQRCPKAGERCKEEPACVQSGDRKCWCYRQ